MRDLWRAGGGNGKLSPRRLNVLIKHLPQESATITALRENTPPDELQNNQQPNSGYGQWSHTDMLLASIYDAIQNNTYVSVKQAGGDMDLPKPLPRPGVEDTTRRKLDKRGLEYLQRIRAGHNPNA